MTAPADLQALRERLEKLAALTVANGATEAEAETAARLTQQLLDRAGLDTAAVQMNRCARRLAHRKGHVSDVLWIAVAQTTGCIGIVRRSSEGRTFIYAGLGSRPQLAEYLHVVCARALETATDTYKATPRYRSLAQTTKRRYLRSFQAGFSYRLADRLAVFADAASERAIAAAGAACTGIPTKKTRRGRPIAAEDAKAGEDAANHVQLARGVPGQQAKPRLIKGAT